MLIKISPTCWLNPQDVSAVVADRQIHAECDDTVNLEFLLRGGQAVRITSNVPFSEVESFLADLVAKLNDEICDTEDSK